MHTMSFRPLAAAALALACAGAAHAVPVFGLTTTNALIGFDSATPNFATTPVQITGLQSANERMLAIDLRPTTGVMYGVSTDSKLYSLSSTGVATYISTLGEPLVGSAVGLDFNPAADLSGSTSLRVITSSGQNLAVNVATGATTIATDVQAGFAGVAYSNNDLNAATATSLYYLDTVSDQLKVATTAFNTPTINTVGSLGFDANGVAGFDIYGDLFALAAMTDADTGKSGLYMIDLLTGAGSWIGAFGLGGDTAISPPLLGLTVAALAPVPEPETYALMLAGLAVTGFVARRRRSA